MAANQDTETSEIDLQKLLRQQLHSLAQFGVRELPVGNGEFSLNFESPQTTENSPSAEKEQPVASAVVKESKPSPPANRPAAAASPASLLPNSDTWGPPTVHEDRSDALEIVNSEVRQCEKCVELCSLRTQTVFGVGSPSARLVFVGEGPGTDEDRQGEPFVGAIGKLLNKILTASQLKREEVYILNTVKCRPPRNRNPSEAEIANCWGYAERQLEIIQPEFICCLGSVAAKTMLQTTQSLGRLRGRFHSWRGARLIATYHPAYLLRNEGAKRHVWEDMKMLVKEMGIDLSK